jgi:hypothetical protein
MWRMVRPKEDEEELRAGVQAGVMEMAAAAAAAAEGGIKSKKIVLFCFVFV